MKSRGSALILLACLALCLVSPVAAQGAKVRLDPETLNLAPGGEGTLDIWVEDVARLAGAEVHLTFDPALVEVLDADLETAGVQIAHGGFLSPDFVAQNTASQSAGTVDYAIACMPVDKAASGDGVLAHIIFRALAEGEAPITISEVLLADEQGQLIAVETGSSMAVVGRSGLPLAWVLVGLIAAVVVLGIVLVLWRAALARRQKGGKE